MTDSISFDRAAAYYDQTRAIPDEIMARVIPMIIREVGTQGECLEIGDLAMARVSSEIEVWRAYRLPQ